MGPRGRGLARHCERSAGVIMFPARSLSPSRRLSFIKLNTNSQPQRRFMSPARVCVCVCMCELGSSVYVRGALRWCCRRAVAVLSVGLWLFKLALLIGAHTKMLLDS